MSEESVELTVQMIEAFNRRDLDASVALLAADVEWEDAGFWSQTPQTYRGQAAVRDWFTQILEPWESLHIEPSEIVESTNGRVFGRMELTARGQASGIETTLTTWGVVTWVNGECAKRQIFLSRAEAIETAGLRE